MSRRFVVDASALVKVVTEEEGSDAVRDWLQAAMSDADELVAPDVLDYELANVIARRFRDLAPAEQAYLLDLALTPVRRERPHLPAVFAAAKEHALTAYDASYLALAKREGATLVSADEPLLAAARREGLAVRHV